MQPFFILKSLTMSEYKIVFSDVDGTLLNKNRELSSETIYQIRRITEFGIPFVMVSARMPLGMLHLYREIPLDTPAICYNGALILNSIENGTSKENIISSETIDHAVASSIYELCNQFDLHFSLFSNNLWMVSKNDEWRLREENNTRAKATLCNNFETKIAELKNDNNPIHKIMIMGNSLIIDGLYNRLVKDYSNAINVYRSKDTYIELTPANVNKAIGCEKLLKSMKISPTNAIAFGDNFNDIEILELVGLGVAMDNSPDEVKAKAKRVTLSNIENGVAKTIGEIFK
ncbi:MAG: hypothetical protein PWR03_154 [Tenuifilum sp.]|jgi:hypothetical protein|nr:hypothetical protein [Tenuifilum sp.]